MAPRIHFRNRRLQLFMAPNTSNNAQKIQPSTPIPAITLTPPNSKSIHLPLRTCNDMGPIDLQGGSDLNPTSKTNDVESIAPATLISPPPSPTLLPSIEDGKFKENVLLDSENLAPITPPKGRKKTTSSPKEKTTSSPKEKTAPRPEKNASPQTPPKGEIENGSPQRARPETSDIVVRRMIGRALGLKIPKKEDEKTVAVSEAMKLPGREERAACWDAFKNAQKP
ncbi:uncharacterized protein BP5553_09664 [Venustampulla echinocandica]|uniref:Uncharacterized protein n=1 Tax=Venustampulla echinocandica TaxID=2656787 RepID=A0A370TBN5_9HELO|nr:uncharacterized protein BP5553_09664 [Venustampulla echinocandica]RDL31455.1 hypothetical protein BP5553_09664 [Venustampulla echinocandica]